jgi:hypothetical protein
MSQWKVSFSQPVNVNLQIDDSDKSPTKEAILNKLDNSDLSRYDKLQAKRCLANLTVPWIVTDNSPVYFYSQVSDLGKISIFVKKEK